MRGATPPRRCSPGTLVTVDRLHADRLRRVDRRRVRQQHVLDRRLRADRLLGRGGRLHAVSRREAAARHQAGRGRARGDLRHAALPPLAPADRRLVDSPQVDGRWQRGRACSCWPCWAWAASSSSSSRPPIGPKCWSKCRCRMAPASTRPAPPPPRSKPGWRKQPEAKIVTAYIGQGAPRFFFAMAPELPDPSFAKIVVLTDNAEGARRAQAAAAPARSPTAWRPRRGCA